MAGYLARAGGSVLAALTIVAGGALVGIDSAGAQLVGTGSAGQAPCEPFTDLDGVEGLGTCDDLRFQEYRPVENFHATLTGRDQLIRGEEDVVRVQFSVTPRGLADPQSGLELASVTIHTPRGFEFKGGKGSLEGVSGVSTTTPLDLTYTVDPETGDVTVTAPAGSMHIPTRQSASEFSSGAIRMELTYVATEYVGDGETSLRFSGTGVPDSGWVATGPTKVVPELGGFSGSLDRAIGRRGA